MCEVKNGQLHTIKTRQDLHTHTQSMLTDAPPLSTLDLTTLFDCWLPLNILNDCIAVKHRAKIIYLDR